jgi:hypothetical protein
MTALDVVLGLTLVIGVGWLVACLLSVRGRE